MGYYDFPHTRNYDTDLGYIIKELNIIKQELKKLCIIKNIEVKNEHLIIETNKEVKNNGC